MPTDAPQNFSEIRWTWSSRGCGWLSTSIGSDGAITQGRQYSPSSDPITEQIGKVSADEAGRIGGLAAAALAAANPPDAAAMAPDGSAPNEEVFDLHLLDAAGARAARVARADLERHPEMTRLRKAIIRARHRAGGGYFSWSNVGARLALAYLALILWMTYLAVSDARNLSRMQREAQRIDAIVTARHGSGGFDKNKYLAVQLTPTGAAKPVDAKIADSLSAQNWNAAKPGSKVRVWYHPVTHKTYLEDDILRNIRDQGGFGLFPLYFSGVLLPVIWFVSRYRAGTYPDGKEFLLNGDRVAIDGKAMPFSDGELLAVRALIRMAE
jgi:hypothetical protein